MNKKNILALFGFIALSEAAGLIGSFFTAPAIDGWYANLAKPDLSPPNWVFAPVWTTLFVLMGIAAFLIWREYDTLTPSGVEGLGIRRKSQIKIALGIFFGQLVLNTLWSIIFFGMRSPGAAFIEIIFLWIAILATIIAFSKISRVGAWLLLPYILWVSFAAYLNYMILILNV